MDTVLSYICLGGGALFLYKSVCTLNTILYIYYETVHDIKVRLDRLEPLAVAAEQMAKEESLHTINKNLNIAENTNDNSTQNSDDHNDKLDDDWWCLFSRTDSTTKKQN